MSCLILTTFIGEKEYQVPVPYYGENPEGNLSAVWELVVETHYEAEGYDGWYNNRAHPDWGGAGMLSIPIHVF